MAPLGKSQPEPSSTVPVKPQKGIKKPRAKSSKPKAAKEAALSAPKVEEDDEHSLFIELDPNSANDQNPKTITTPDPPPDDEAAVTLALNALEDEEIRVVRKEKCAAIGLATVAKLKVLLQQNMDSFKGHAAFVEHCDEILNMGKLPRILIGVLGYTGSGKSSLINALVEQETIVPCNAMRASTSAVVEIAYNESNDPHRAFRAEVEFVTQQEWEDEYEILASDIKDRPVAEQLSLNSVTDAGLAFAKLSAIYPKIHVSKLVGMTPAQLAQERNLSGVLGKTVTIYEPTASNFSEAVKPYIDSSNKGTEADQLAYWPLVRLVKVFIKADLLKNGLVLVDLPGLGDANLGRTRVTENSIKKLTHIWVVADIVRAIDDKVANELISRSFKRQLFLDGRYHENFVTFVMTKSDQINVTEVVNSLRLDTTVLKEEVACETQLTDELQTLKDQLSKQKQRQKQFQRLLKKTESSETPNVCPSDNKKRSLEEADSEPDRPQISEERTQILANLNAAAVAETELSGRITKVKKSINALNTQMRAICIRERNNYTSLHLQMDFKTGQADLLEELELDNTNITLSTIQDNGKKSLSTFCVSAKAYQKLQGRFRRDNSIKGFLSINDTNIPSLKTFAKQCTLPGRESVVDKILTELNLFRITLELWAENRGTRPQLTPQQRDELKKSVEEHFKKMKAKTDKQRAYTMANIRNTIRSNIERRLADAVIKGTGQAAIISKHKDPNFRTFKAICKRKGGCYHTGKKVFHHWNEDYLEAFIEPLTGPWNEVFQVRIPQKNIHYADEIIAGLRQFQQEIHGSVTQICGKYALAHNALKQVPILEDQIRAKVMQALKACKDSAQDAHRAVGYTVVKYMTPYYDAAYEIKDKGASKRQQQSLIDFTQKKAQPMYQEASDTLSTKLDDMRSVLSREIISAARTAQSKLKSDIIRVISLGAKNEASNKSTATAELRRQVKDGLKAMEASWMDELENPSTDLRARDPFANISLNADDEVDDGNVSDGSSDSSESESEDSEEDNDDSDDEDFQE